MTGNGHVAVCWLHPGTVSSVFARSLVDSLLHDLQRDEPRIVSHGYGHVGNECGTGGLVAGRNDLVRIVLDHADVEWMFMVDSDMGFSADAIDQLISAADPLGRPVVGALCFAHKTDGRKEHNAIRYVASPTVYDYVERPDKVGFVARVAYERDAVTPCSATGAAAVLVHRSVLQAVRDRFGDVWFDPITHPTGPTTFSEDLSFCVRLAAVGVPIHVHTGVRTTHHKGGVFLDEEFFDVQQASPAAIAAA